MSDFHPETWNPAWTLATILNGLHSFFYENGKAAGAVDASDEERRLLAAASHGHNVSVRLRVGHEEQNPDFRELFPDLLPPHLRDLP